jgi:hypothetical protein
MGTRPSLDTLMALNLALLALALAQQIRSAFAQEELPVLRGRPRALAPTRPTTHGNSPCTTCSAAGRTSSICSRS